MRIDYDSLMDDAVLRVVKSSLEHIKNNTMPGDHHFYITFSTTYPGVTISPKLKAIYPENITIVLKHEFQDLEVTDNKFCVTLTFSGAKERLEVPYKALRAFADPSVNFGLKFRTRESTENSEKPDVIEDKSTNVTSNVVHVDFRKK